ncbi:Transient receptor putative cation channel subfamily M member 2 [Cichlidogyrus casuarinus]|uniref:Transient receptor putative cation channel subfamily M member 2 n=1 Tax=Cichlidogyrus casuarinus TaxID=1844966 RepID=A0ABD2QLE0_9PLAT
MPQESFLNPGTIVQEAIKQEKKQAQGLAGTADITQEFKQNIVSHGEIQFHGNDEPNIVSSLPLVKQLFQYTIIDDKVTEPQARGLLKTKWKLTSPTLIVAVYGSEIDMSKRLTMTIKKGLWKAAESAGCWVITDGLDNGIGKVCAEACKDYSEAYGGNHMIAIGIDAKMMAMTEVQYPYYDPEEEILKPKIPRSCNGFPIGESAASGMLMDLGHCVRLSKDNNFLLLVDKQSDFDVELYSEMYAQIRCLIEKTVASWRSVDAPPGQPEPEATLGANFGAMARRPTMGLNTSSASIVQNGLLKIPTIGDELAVNQSRKRSSIRRQSSSKRPSIVVIEEPEGDRSEVAELPIGPANLLSRNSSLKPSRNNSIRRGSLLLPSRNLEGSQLAPDSELYGGSGSPSIEEVGNGPATANRIPICGLLGGGNQFCIHQIYYAVKMNRCPMVVIRVSLHLKSYLSF